MPKALCMELRQAIIDRYNEGETLSAIAVRLGLSYSTVRAVWRRYRDQGPAGLAPDYDNCGRHESDFPADMLEASIFLRQQHPRWGTTRICECLGERFPDQSVPTVRTVQRWMQAAGLAQPRGKPASGE